MQTEPIACIKKIVEYQDSARLTESIAKMMDVNGASMHKLFELLIETARESGQVQERVITKLIEGFDKNVDAITSSYCDNIRNANSVFDQRLAQNQKDVRFPKFFSVVNKSQWSKKAWKHAFEDYTEHVAMIGQTHRFYNECIVGNYGELVKLFLNVLGCREQVKSPAGNIVPLLTDVIVDAARQRRMI